MLLQIWTNSLIAYRFPVKAMQTNELECCLILECRLLPPRGLKLLF